MPQKITKGYHALVDAAAREIEKLGVEQATVGRAAADLHVRADLSARRFFAEFNNAITMRLGRL